jgi:feruloyl esterase
LFAWQVGPVPGILNLGYAFATNIYKYFIFQDPEWDYSTYDFENWEKDTHLAGTVLNATDPDIKDFAARGGKLILWHGWSDAALPAEATIDYYEDVLAHDPNAMDYARLFMIPGCYHCAGGPGVSDVDWLAVIRAWVEEGKAPDRIIAKDGDSGRTRPLVPYPQRVEYDGDGDTDDAENFVLEKD